MQPGSYDDHLSNPGQVLIERSGTGEDASCTEESGKERTHKTS